MQCGLLRDVIDNMEQESGVAAPQGSSEDRWMKCEDSYAQAEYWFDSKTQSVSWVQPATSDIENQNAAETHHQGENGNDGNYRYIPQDEDVQPDEMNTSIGGIASRTRSSITREILAEMEAEDRQKSRATLSRISDDVNPIVQKAKEECATLGERTLIRMFKNPKPQKCIKRFKKILVKVGIADMDGAHDALLSPFSSVIPMETSRKSFPSWFADHREQFKLYGA